ncbi:inositol monophosphatase family protein [Spirillospora sp. NPDC052269]
MTTTEIGSLLRTAEQAALAAGRYLARHHRSGASTRVKGLPHDVVTDADARAEAMIREALTAAHPASEVVGEESGRSGYGEVTWYVDPIDGTHNFARGLGLFAVSIGVHLGGAPVAGVVYEPFGEELFTGADGTLLVNGVTPERRVPDPLPVVLTDIPTAGLRDPVEYELFADLNDTTDLRRIGSSALALAYVAGGRADLAANADVFAWDVAAGRALVTAAGGGFTGVPDEPGAERRGGFVAWGPGFDRHGARLAEAMGAISHLTVSAPR